MPTQPAKEKEFFMINTHTHIFTKAHTPRHLAKKFLPWPFYKWLGTDRVVGWLENYYASDPNFFTYEARNRRWSTYRRKIAIQRNPLLIFLNNLGKLLIWAVFTYYLLQWLRPAIGNTYLGKWLYSFIRWSGIETYAYDFDNRWNLFFFICTLLLLFGYIRRRLWKLIKGRLLKMLGKDRVELLMRYLNIIRYSDYEGMGTTFSKLKQQYPPKSKFVVLPMDMAYMEAGPIPHSYDQQMQDLLTIKKNKPDSFYPFVFVDPRRIAQQKASDPFCVFDTSNPEKLVLKPCALQRYLKGGCIGIKIYPALGYYPFDKELLPLWLYCAQNELPITTHCSVGPIFYRGAKKKTWDRHPILEEIISGSKNEGNLVLEKMRLLQLKNKDFQANFTHPLNYACLVHEPLLKKVLDVYNDPELNTLFGYKNGKLARNLDSLKVNLAHYGGAENWDRFLEKDRQQEANELLYDPTRGLGLKEELSNLTNLYKFWHYVDWFSLISSMLLEFDNIYADVSYTVHDNQYLNLLSEVMQHPKLQQRLLFGTDFYVVSNHKTEKQFWIDMQHSLSEESWKLLAHTNPRQFLNL